MPVSLVHRVDLDFEEPRPALLYGYGSYETPIDPSFSVARLSMLDRGMLFAIAHVRGGGEMGGQEVCCDHKPICLRTWAAGSNPVWLDEA